MVPTLRGTLQTHVENGSVAGAVGLVARGDHLEMAAVGSRTLDPTAAMSRDSIFRIASVTKLVTAAAVLMLVEDGRLALTDPIARWLPELAAPLVVRKPDSPLDDVVPAERSITVADLLSSRAGWGFGPDFSLPALQALVALHQPPMPAGVPPPDQWLAALAKIPMLHQPGHAWLYNTCSDLQGVLIARVSGGPLPDFFAERLFEPLGMVDTGFHVPAGRLDRFTGYYRAGSDGGLELVDAPDGEWSSPPAFPSGGGGLVSTVDDLHAFCRLLLAEGSVAGRHLLTAASVRAMTTDHLTPAQRAAGALFLDGQGWGLGGSVDVAAVDPWNVPGRYGWVGGTGTAVHVTPATGAVTILLSQLEMGGPASTGLMHDFWRYAADARPGME